MGLSDAIKEVEQLVADIPEHKTAVQSLVELVPRLELIVSKVEGLVGSAVGDVKAITSLDTTKPPAAAAAEPGAAVQLAPSVAASFGSETNPTADLSSPAYVTPAQEPAGADEPPAQEAAAQEPAAAVQLPEPPAPAAA